MDMPFATTPEAASWAETLIHSRRTTLPKRLVGPGPDPGQRLKILWAAAAAPDHDQILPWRLIEIPTAQRPQLAEAFRLALLERDANASAEEQQMAHDKALRSPWLLLAVLKTAPAGDEIPDAERLISAGAALQNMLLQATAMGLGSGLTSGKALQSTAIRQLFQLRPDETALCFVNIGHVAEQRRARPRPTIDAFFQRL